MVGSGHCPMISKYGPSLSKAVGPVDPSFFSCEKSHFNKSYSESTNIIKQKVHVDSQYSKTCLKKTLKIDKTKILMTNGSLMKVKSITKCSLTALRDNWSSFLSGCLRQVLLFIQHSIYIYAFKCLCQCVGKVYNPSVNFG